MTPVSAQTLRLLAKKVARLNIDRRDGEKFFIDRDLIRAELTRLARRVEIAQSQAG
jgi:hypothetical protein